MPPKARNRGLSPAVIDEIVTAYLAGTTIRQICRDLGMHRTTVDNCLKRAGVKQPRQPVMDEADIDEAEAAYVAGESWAAIAPRFNADPATIGRLLKLRGVTMRPRRGGIRKDDGDRQLRKPEGPREHRNPRVSRTHRPKPPDSGLASEQ